MKNEYWEQFSATGKVDDYLSYREIDAMNRIADEYVVEDGAQTEGHKGESIDYGNRYGA